MSGFKKQTSKDVRIILGKTTMLDVKLDVGPLEESVVVSADPPIVDVTSKQVGGNVSNRELVNLPSINRNYIGFVGLLPGIVPNISTESFGSDAIVSPLTEVCRRMLCTSTIGASPVTVIVS